LFKHLLITIIILPVVRSKSSLSQGPSGLYWNALL